MVLRLEGVRRPGLGCGAGELLGAGCWNCGSAVGGGCWRGLVGGGLGPAVVLMAGA